MNGEKLLVMGILRGRVRGLGSLEGLESLGV